jgi:hypothetical protein
MFWTNALLDGPTLAVEAIVQGENMAKENND